MLRDDETARPDGAMPQSRGAQDHRWLMVSGVAALAVLVLLVVAVLYTARSATETREAPSTTVPSTPSTPAAVTSTPTTTSYLPPRVQTSEATTIAPEPIAPIETATADRERDFGALPRAHRVSARPNRNWPGGSQGLGATSEQTVTVGSHGDDIAAMSAF